MDSQTDDSDPPPAYTTTTTTTNNNNSTNSGSGSRGRSRQVKQSRGSNKTFCRRLVKVVKSLGGQAAMLFAYTFLGAWMMMSIEGPLEDSRRQEVVSARGAAWRLLKNSTLDLQKGLINHTEWDRQTHDTLLGFESLVHQSGVSSSSKKKWTFFGSVLFCFTTYTTIGYGNIAPATKAGRIATMLYAILGIPLALIVLADLGRRFAVAFKFLWGFLRRYYYTGYCCTARNKVTKTSYDMTNPSSSAGDCEQGSQDNHLDIQRQGSYRKTDESSHHTADAYREVNERGERGAGDLGEGGGGGKRPNGRKGTEVEVEEDHTRLRAGKNSLIEDSGKTAEDADIVDSPENLGSYTADRKQNVGTKVSSEHTQRDDTPKGATKGHTDHRHHEDTGKYTEIHDEYKLPVPVALGFIFAYIFVGAGIYTLWEDWSYLESFYFVFITTSTIGFGDVLPEHPNFFLLSCVYTFFGLALVSMTVNVIMEFMAKTIDLAKDSVDSAAEKAVAKAKAAKGVLAKVGSRAKSSIHKTIGKKKKKKRKKSKTSAVGDDGIEVKDGSGVDSDPGDDSEVRVRDGVLGAGESSKPDVASAPDATSQSRDKEQNGGGRIPSVSTVSLVIDNNNRRARET